MTWHRVRRWGWGCALVLWGCSPTFNWRQVRAEGSSVAVLLPCKPDRATRTVTMAGQAVQLSMLSCDVGDLTFALASAPLPRGLSPEVARQAWQQASLASLHAAPDAARPWTPGVRPATGATVLTGWQAVGTRPEGQPVAAQALQVVHGAELLQLVVYGPVTPDVAQTLWEGVQPDALR